MPPNNTTEAEYFLQQIPTLKTAGLTGYKVLSAGSSNFNYRVTTQSGEWVVRINRSSLGVDRMLEAAVLNLIAPLGLSPKVIENNASAGYLITEYINKHSWDATDFKHSQHIEALQAKLATMHRIPFTHPSSRLDNRVQHYITAIGTVPLDLERQIMSLINELEKLGFWQANRYLFHSDLNPGNLLGHNSPLIIDWEFAGQGHPLIDWLMMEIITHVDLSSHYPENIEPAWIAPCRQFLQLMLKIWYLNPNSHSINNKKVK